MLWLLPYFGYALAASAVASAAGYAAVTRFSVVQRVLAVALDRTLRKITDNLEGGAHSYNVEHTGTGAIAGPCQGEPIVPGPPASWLPPDSPVPCSWKLINHTGLTLQG